MKRLDPTPYDTDKNRLRHYLQNYHRWFETLADREIVLLELGVGQGGSLLMWRDFFHRATIIGLDVRPVDLEDSSGRIRVYQGEQQDTQLLDRIARESAPGGFDIVIDDCSHIGALTRISFWHLFENHLKPGGLYAIEDWGTGYWPSWPDGAALRTRSHFIRQELIDRLDDLLWTGVGRSRFGRRALRLARRRLYPRRFRSHDHGMVGVVKELIDECGAGDATLPGFGASGKHRSSRIQRMELSHGHVIILKAEHESPGLPTTLKNATGRETA